LAPAWLVWQTPNRLLPTIVKGGLKSGRKGHMENICSKGHFSFWGNQHSAFFSNFFNLLKVVNFFFAGKTRFF
jgi:hypothetical protein